MVMRLMMLVVVYIQGLSPAQSYTIAPSMIIPLNSEGVAICEMSPLLLCRMSFSMQTQQGSLKVSFELEGDTLNGGLSTPQGNLPIVGKKSS